MASPSTQEPLDSHQPQALIEAQSPHAVATPHPGAHCSAAKRQSAQVPPVGPPRSPVMQAPLDSHHPHADIPVHAPQPAPAAHGSGPPHAPTSHAHPSQLPGPGPLESPVWHVPVEVQKPQPASAVQPSQVEPLAQGSPDPAHSTETQTHSSQVPAIGPAIAPSMQEPTLRQ